jgi:hypothetical protein
MVTYELNGEKKRAFVKAATASDATKEFISTNSACKILEVTA